jgi:uncharacterized protein with HEPN domain
MSRIPAQLLDPQRWRITQRGSNGNRLLLLALVKDVEIIGEAASRVSAETRQDCVDIPRQDIVAMRHRLIHGYFDIDFDIVWSTVTEDLPPLVAQLERALASVTESLRTPADTAAR